MNAIAGIMNGFMSNNWMKMVLFAFIWPFLYFAYSWIEAVIRSKLALRSLPKEYREEFVKDINQSSKEIMRELSATEKLVSFCFGYCWSFSIFLFWSLVVRGFRELWS